MESFVVRSTRKLSLMEELYVKTTVATKKARRYLNAVNTRENFYRCF